MSSLVSLHNLCILYQQGLTSYLILIFLPESVLFPFLCWLIILLYKAYGISVIVESCYRCKISYLTQLPVWCLYSRIRNLQESQSDMPSGPWSALWLLQQSPLNSHIWPAILGRFNVGISQEGLGQNDTWESLRRSLGLLFQCLDRLSERTRSSPHRSGCLQSGRLLLGLARNGNGTSGHSSYAFSWRSFLCHHQSTSAVAIWSWSGGSWAISQTYLKRLFWK